MNPLNAFNYLIHSAFIRDRFLSKKSLPGEVVQAMSPEVRHSLSELTSDELNRLRPDQATMFIEQPGFCGHGFRFSERCDMCKRHMQIPKPR